jgi:hypothetical protein
MAFSPRRRLNPGTFDVTTNRTVNCAPNSSIVAVFSIILTPNSQVVEEKWLFINYNILTEFDFNAVLFLQDIFE